MIKIGIADDEIVDRQGLRFLIGQIDAETEIFEFSNGLEAMEGLEQNPVDLLITDIKMPGLSGLDLVEEVSEKNLCKKIIVISAHGEFEYAQKFLQFGVENYILKPVNIKECKKTLEKVFLDIKIDNDAEISKKICDLVNGKNVEISKWNYGLNIILISSELSLFDGSDSLYIKNLMKELNSSFSVIINDYRFLLFSDVSYEEVQQKANDIMKNKNSFTSEQRVDIILGGIISNINELYNIYVKMDNLSEYKFYNREPKVYSVFDPPLSSDIREDYFTRATIISDLVKNKNSAVKKELASMFLELESTRTISALYVKYICSELIKNVLNGQENFNQKAFEGYLHKMFEAGTFNEIQSICEEFIDACLQSDDEDEDRIKQVVEMVFEYIRNNYNRDISLEMLAQSVHFSPNYLCSILKKQTGESFVKHLTNYRLEQSRRLLNSTVMKVREISELVGYKDVSYFCSLFRNHYGYTPDQYRRRKNAKINSTYKKS